jgi:hypothetical protein
VDPIWIWKAYSICEQILVWFGLVGLGWVGFGWVWFGLFGSEFSKL